MPAEEAALGADGFGYVLWWGFDGATQFRLQRAIGCIAQRFEATPFTPHVTIASHFVEPRHDLARSLSRELPLPLRLSCVVTRDERFRRLVLEADSAEELLEQRRILRSAAPEAQIPRTPPHVSLLYSGSELRALEPLRKALSARLPLCLELTALLLLHCPSSDPLSWSVLGRYGAA